MCGCEDRPCCGCDDNVFDDFDTEIQSDECVPEDFKDTMSDVEADADTLRSAGMGTDEDYGSYDWAPDEW